MKTVLHVIDTTGPGGAESVFINLAQSMADAGFTPIALIRGDGWVKDNLQKRGIKTYVRDCKGSFNLPFLYFLMRLIARERVSLVQAHLLGSNIYASVAGGLMRVPVIATFHGKVDISPDERWLKLKFALINRFARRIVCVSGSLKEHLCQRVEVSPSKLLVIENGVRAPELKRDRQRFRAGHQLAPSSTLLGALGNIRKAKAYGVFIEAVRLLRARGHDVQGLVAGQGQGALLQALENQVAQAGLGEHFRFLGFTDDPDYFLSNIDVYVLSSSSEGHPLAITQAMLMGLPIVATACGVEEILRDGEDALIVTKDDPVALADGVAALLASEDRGQNLGRHARERAQRLYSIDLMLEKYLQEYRQATSPARSRLPNRN